MAHALASRIWGAFPTGDSASRLERLEVLTDRLEGRLFPDLHAELAEMFRETAVLLSVVEDESHHFSWVSDSWERVLGWTRAEMVGVPYPEFVHPDDLEKTETQHRSLDKEVTSPSAFHNRYRTKGGEYVRLLWATTRWRDGSCFCLAFPALPGYVASLLVPEV